MGQQIMPLRYIILPAALLLSAAGPHAQPPSPFYSEMDTAMSRMMEQMHVEPTGDVDRDFVRMMVPHHEGAIEMAVAQLKYGKDPVLKRIAQEIIIEQRQEIDVMKMAVGDPLPPSNPVPTQQQKSNPRNQ
jgi:uncharacterized protein (DUF305 family)